MKRNMSIHRSYNFRIRRSLCLRPMAQICGHSLAGIAGLNPDGGMDFCLLRSRALPLRRASPSCKGGGVIPNVCVCVCVCDQVQQ